MVLLKDAELHESNKVHKYKLDIKLHNIHMDSNWNVGILKYDCKAISYNTA